jgi:two-component system, OmpR family, KDP operon response regulator KdpE
MSDMTKVLVVEDDPNIVDLIRSNLRVRGYDVVVSTTGADVDYLVAAKDLDLVLLDLMLPQADGFELCRYIRSHSNVAIIVLSAKGDESDKVRALQLGADDYMTKPFGVEELLARIQATLRRTRLAPTVPEEPQREPVIIGDVVIDTHDRRVTKGGELVHLTPTEFSLLEQLALRPGALVSHSELLRTVWGRGYETSTEYTRVYVGRIRQKLETEPGSLIITEPRAGYRLAMP